MKCPQGIKCPQGMRQWLVCLMLLVGVATVPPFVVAKEAAPMAADPVLEKRVMGLALELRCLVCQNQSLGDSHSDFAIDLREEMRQQMRQGKSDDEVIEFMVQRYGDFIRFRPPVKSTTFLLWFGPLILFVIAAGVLAFNLMRRRKTVKSTPLSDEERKRAEALLGDK